MLVHSRAMLGGWRQHHTRLVRIGQLAAGVSCRGEFRDGNLRVVRQRSADYALPGPIDEPRDVRTGRQCAVGVTTGAPHALLEEHLPRSAWRMRAQRRGLQRVLVDLDSASNGVIATPLLS